MKHLIVVGACYLDTILKNVTINFTCLPFTNLPSVYLFSRPRMQSYVPPVSISDVGATVPIRFRCWSSYSQSMMVSSCIWYRLCPAPRHLQRGVLYRLLVRSQRSTLAIVYIAMRAPRRQAVTLFAVKHQAAARL